MNALLLLSLLPLVAPGAKEGPSTSKSPQLSDLAARHEGTEFGPFDAGSARPVTRHGDRGRSRRPHPAVGDKGHIPGGGAPEPMLRTDPDLPELAASAPNAAAVGLSSNPLFLASLVYSNFLTRMDGPRCQHLPTCSRFASQAVGRHGLLGITMGLDRILQPPSSSSVRLLPELEYGGVFRHYDPLENYEFWHPERFTGLPPPVDEQPLVLTAVAESPTPSAP